ncbi:hypothetical protein OQA88_11911 [Cercophora sp. LCS_1]
MGIPHLKRLLEPYSSVEAIPPTCRATIDGPAFAYHIFSICSRKTSSKSPFEQPSYDALAKTAIAWLGKISSCGIEVSAIFFDGLLPDWKRPERMQRLSSTSKQILHYHLAHPAGFPRQRPQFDGSSPVELFPKPRGSESGTAAPVPPFLVPAVLDALRTSPTYGPRTKVVAGEADEFCAENARANGGIVFTSDSDLLIHDLGPNSSVVFFADIDLNVEAARLEARQFRPGDVCKRLSLKADNGLTHLGFEILRDPYASLEQAAERARRTATASSEPSGFNEFSSQYLAPAREDEGFHDLSSSLDPRVAEISLSDHPLGGTLEPRVASPSGDRPGLAMFLPSLIDCPTRTSAWESSKGIRELAYSLLPLVRQELVKSVSEFRRLQSPSSSGIQFKFLSHSKLNLKAAELASLLSKIQANGQDPGLACFTLAVYQDALLAIDQGKDHYLAFQLLRDHTLKVINEGSWEFIHFLAQTQACLYSLRMLGQLLKTAERCKAKLSVEMIDLSKKLELLPPLTEYPSARTFADSFSQFEGNGFACLTDLFDGNDMEAVREQIEAIRRPPTPKKGRKSRKRKAPASPADYKTLRPISTNPFAALAGSDE